MKALDDIFPALAASSFRRRFKLRQKELDYLREKGIDTVLAHAEDFIARRLSPAAPVNDGKQTPYRGHPVFIAQHATACCCRGCLVKWHGISKGRELDAAETAHVLAALRRWLEEQAPDAAARSRPR